MQLKSHSHTKQTSTQNPKMEETSVGGGIKAVEKKKLNNKNNKEAPHNKNDHGVERLPAEGGKASTKPCHQACQTLVLKHLKLISNDQLII